jgi:hypothetical protein
MEGGSSMAEIKELERLWTKKKISHRQFLAR